jgi:hypothetical protein
MAEASRELGLLGQINELEKKHDDLKAQVHSSALASPEDCE